MNVIYEPKGRAKEYAPLACNLYMGCTHGCTYCYAPGCMHKTSQSWHGEAVPRKDVLSLFEKDVKKILVHIDLFAKHFETFKGRFAELGGLVSKLDQKYHEISETSFKNLDTKVRHIEEYKKGRGLDGVSSDGTEGS